MRVGSATAGRRKSPLRLPRFQKGGVTAVRTAPSIQELAVRAGTGVRELAVSQRQERCRAGQQPARAETQRFLAGPFTRDDRDGTEALHAKRGPCRSDVRVEVAPPLDEVHVPVNLRQRITPAPVLIAHHLPHLRGPADAAVSLHFGLAIPVAGRPSRHTHLGVSSRRIPFKRNQSVHPTAWRRN